MPNNIQEDRSVPGLEPALYFHRTPENQIEELYDPEKLLCLIEDIGDQFFYGNQQFALLTFLLSLDIKN